MKRIIPFLVLILLFSSISGVFAGGQREESANEDTTTIRVAWWTNEVRTAVTLETIAEYEAANPGVKIVPEYTGWGGYWDKLATQIAAKDVPDVMQMVITSWTEYSSGKIITPLNDYSMDFDKIDSASLGQWVSKEDGKTYGLPLGVNGWSLMYNPDIFDQAGIAYPTADWSWADFEKMALTITEKTGHPGVSFVLFYQDLPFLARGAGYNLFSDDGKSWGFNDFSFLTDYFAMYHRLHKAGALIDHTFTVTNFNNWAANPMAMGEAGMIFIPSNQGSPIVDGVGKALPLTVIPGTAEGKTQQLDAALAFSLAEGSEVKETAANFINYFATNKEALAIGKANRGVPATAEARGFMLDSGIDAGLAEVFKFVDIAGPISTPLDWEPNPKQGELNDLCDDIFARIMFEELTPEEGAAEFFTKGNEILAR